LRDRGTYWVHNLPVIFIYISVWWSRVLWGWVLAEVRGLGLLRRRYVYTFEASSSSRSFWSASHDTFPCGPSRGRIIPILQMCSSWFRQRLPSYSPPIRSAHFLLRRYWFEVAHDVPRLIRALGLA
jgi:hypothetical protein